jgi:uncharacterized membrane protein YphA (DoxX/SURF4 family)
MQSILRLYQGFIYTMQALSPAMLLALRLWIAHVFWVSGVLKATNWDNTLTLFMYEHPVPFLPTQLAAVLGTSFEILCPILLSLGLATRLATLPLIAMTLVINFTYLEATEHYYWLMILGVLLTNGAGRISVDAFLSRRYGRTFSRRKTDMEKLQQIRR